MNAARYERKFLVQDLDAAAVAALVRLHPALFRTAYPARRVSNLYLDDADFGSWRANAYGVAVRAKLRIRWYGSTFGCAASPALERKARVGLVGTKASFPLPPLDVRAGISAADVRACLEAAALPAELREELARTAPVLLNAYERTYLLSADGRFRLTLDSALEARPFDRLGSSFLHVRRQPGVVLELKYDPRHDRDADAVSAAFPFRLTKSSKYAAAVERLFA